MARCELTCIRHTLFVVNTILWIIGCAILSVGLWLRFSFGVYATILHQYTVLSLDSICLATGVITFIVAFFACCGAWFKNRCLLMTYFLLLVLVFVLQLVVAITTFAFKEPMTEAIHSELQAGLRHSYNDTEHNPVAITWNALQHNFKCCGVQGANDWYDISAWPGKDWVPSSCCKPSFTDNPGCGRSGDDGTWYESGCFNQVRLWFIQKLHIFGIVALVLLFLQLFGLISSMLLFCSIDTRRRSRTYKSYQTDS